MNRDFCWFIFKNVFRAILLLTMGLALAGCGENSSVPTPNPGLNAGPQGILPFETTSDSVVFRSSLTSASSIAAVGGYEEQGSTNEFDASLGMKPKIVPGGIPGCRFTSSSIPALTNLPSGQMSIEVEREWLASANSEARSMGYRHAEREHLLSYGPGGAIDAGLLYVQPDQSLVWFFKASEILRDAHYVSTNRSERFARITLSWSPTEARLYVDGLLMGVIDRTDQGSNRFSTIHVGNFIGSTLYGFRGNYFVRNLIVARTPVAFRVPLIAEHVMQMGDSFSSGDPLQSVFAKYDGTISNTVIRQLAQRGIGYRKYTVYSHGGGNVQDNGPKALETDVSGTGKTRAEALQENPTLVVFITAGNDAGIFDEARYTTDLHDHIEAFLGENGHVPTTVKRVIVTTIASNLSATNPAILSMNGIMRSLPAWWNSTYPHKAGSVSVIDMWNIFGGVNVDRSLFGISDPVHPAANGNMVYGRAITERILTFTGTDSTR